MKHIMVVFGTRPEVIKLAPLLLELQKWETPVKVTACSTGQHRQMLDTALGVFGLQADLDLNIMQPGQKAADVVGRLLLEFGKVFDAHKPDVVVVQGDTATVMAGALAGFLHKVEVAHVEAGLRTADKRAPFPEEVNRRVAGVCADYHFPPTAASRDNLLREGVPSSDVILAGNTVVDALQWMGGRVSDIPLPEEVRNWPGRVALVTAHRQESFGEPFRNLCLALRDIAERFEDLLLVYPVHLNPNVQAPVNEILGGTDRVRLLEPLPYDRFVSLLYRADLVLTDSGGIQEEAPAIGKPTLVLREKTERPEAVDAGVVRLVGTDRERIVSETITLLTDPERARTMSRRALVYGDGLASRRICEVLVDGALKSGEFSPRIEEQ